MIIPNPKHKRGTRSLAYASGYEKQSVFKLRFAMSIPAILYNNNLIVAKNLRQSPCRSQFTAATK